MSRRFTVITLLPPEPAAWAWSMADLSPDLIVTVDDASESWRVADPSGGQTLFTVDVPLRVRVPGEIRRLFGHDAGFDLSGPNPEPETYGIEVHVLAHEPEAESLAARFCRSIAHLGHGTCIDHDARFTHLGETGPEQRRGWA
ncbi:hypothetical protein [Micrococcus porci]|uniref:hypothetical protein n=1 Tax=Micrococcus porci TaxID=2856555 RepID=UPI003CE8914B